MAPDVSQREHDLMAFVYVNVQSLTGVVIAEVGSGGGGYSWNGTVFSRATGSNPATTPARFTAPSGFRYVTIQLPVGYTYSGKIRDTVTAVDNSSPYVKTVGQVISASGSDDVPAPGTDVETDDPGTVIGGITIYTHAGVQDGSPGPNSASWSIEIEVDDTPPPPGAFWTNFIRCREFFEE